MSEDNPLVSVIMATFNEPPEIIESAIGSILNQTYQNLELLIFDDSTKQDTIAAIDKMGKDSRVSIHRFTKRKGFVKSLNEGLRCAKGKYIARMDGDDFSLPERIEKEVDYLSRNPEITVVGGQMDIMNEWGQVISHRTYPTHGAKLWLFSCLRNPLAHPTIMMRREIIDKGYCYNENLKMSEDLDFWLRLLNDGYTIANMKDTVLRFRVQDDFNAKRVSNTQRKYMADVRKANFKWSHPLHAMLSVLAGWVFTQVSPELIKRFYNKENKKMERKEQ